MLEKNFIPRRESAEGEPEGVHLNILCFNQLVPWTVLQESISASETKISKCFIPRREAANAAPKAPRGQIEYSFHFIGVGNVYLIFNFALVIRLFETLKMFYPPKGDAKHIQ